MPNIGGIIKSLQNIMRKDQGVSGDAQRIEQLGWMITLKIIDDKEAEMELLNDDYVSVIPSALQWRSWAGGHCENYKDIAQHCSQRLCHVRVCLANSYHKSVAFVRDAMKDFVANTLFPGLQNLDVSSGNRRAALIRDIFAGTNNYMKNGTIIRQVVNKLNEIDFNASVKRMPARGCWRIFLTASYK